jgi:hypothetical protein
MASASEQPTFERFVVDGVEVPAALLLHFLAEAAADQVDITNFTAAIAPGQASGLLPWTQANDVSFESLLNAIAGELRAAAARQAGEGRPPGAARSVNR